MTKKLIIIIVLLTFAATLSVEAASIKLKLAVVNPSERMTQTTPVRYDLPRGIQPEHIIDRGDMDLAYDFDKGNYYVYQEVTLEPSEKKVLVIEIEDIWLIPGKEINFLKTHTQGLIEKLEGTKHWEVGTELSEKILNKLDGISKKQRSSALSAREKMNLYYENIALFDATKGDIGMLENLTIDVGGIVEERVRVPETLAISVPLGKGIGPWEVIEYRIGISNPSKEKKQTATLEWHLPAEVTPSAVLDADGLELRYDFARERFCVFGKVELEPDEKKTFTLKIKDIWRVAEVEIKALKSHAGNLLLLLEGTEYAAEANHIKEDIFYNLDEIKTSQNLKVPPPEHIAYYRQNLKIFEMAKEDVAKLEKMSTQSGSTPGVTIAKAERKKGGGEEVKRKRGYEGITLIAKTIFKGKAPTVATTWKIIFSIIAFVGVVSLVFFALWHAQVRRGGRLAEKRKKETKEKPNV